jgi:hypothetical protein
LKPQASSHKEAFPEPFPLQIQSADAILFVQKIQIGMPYL